MEHGRVFAGVVTYNRKRMLVECLGAILEQSTPPDLVFVLDNGSSDGTDAAVAAAGYLDHPRLEYHRLASNVGPSAAFSKLFSLLFLAGCDWAWVMDDDVLPSRTALEELFSAFRRCFGNPGDVGFLLSSSIGLDGRADWIPMIGPDWASKLDAGLVRITEGTFSSVLIPRTTITEFGIPSPDFYYGGEDADFTRRVTQRRPGFIVGRSQVVHRRTTMGILDLVTENDPKRIRNWYYLIRNRLYLERRYGKKKHVYLQVLRILFKLGQCFAGWAHPLAKTDVALRGLCAGFVFSPDYPQWPPLSRESGEVDAGLRRERIS